MEKSHLAGLFLRRLYPASQTKSSLPRSFSKRYATQGSTAHNASTPSRKQVTVVNDDGRVQWGSLSRREKLARTTQQSFNLLTIFAGVIMTGGVITVLYLEVFSSESKTNHFNRAVNRVKKDGRCVDVLGPSKQIIAYGESTWSKWARARPIASKLTKDNFGTEHLVMHFNVTILP
ncbi:MAG: hypothetical protein M1825_003588 [Sarcosagium campestre]|nr:MAG: hypothetical protein M1825_003588 [Sarcosagium campestre]